MGALHLVPAQNAFSGKRSTLPFMLLLFSKVLFVVVVNSPLPFHPTLPPEHRIKARLCLNDGLKTKRKPRKKTQREREGLFPVSSVGTQSKRTLFYFWAAREREAKR